MLRFLGLSFLLTSMLLSAPAVATVHLFNFVARSDDAYFEAPAGTLIHGSFSYDDTVLPLYSEETSGIRDAFYSDPSISLSVVVLGKEYTRNADLRMQDRIRIGVPEFEEEEGEEGPSDELEEGDYFGIYYTNQWNAVPDPDVTFMAFDFQDDLAASFSSYALPTVFPKPSGEPEFCDPLAPDADLICGPRASFIFANNFYQAFTATVLSITPASPAAVPEPSVWAMLLAGFGCVGTALRRRRPNVRINARARPV